MGDVIEVGWSDVLEEEGIFKHGYGSISKYAMLDPELSLTAKAIYAYLCACAGSGTTSYPGRDTITSRLGLNKDTYHKYSNELRDAGYITVRRAPVPKGERHHFTHNIYRIEANPKRFAEDPKYKQPGLTSSAVSFMGMKAAGYGMIARTVMDDMRLSAKAKALYAYLASYTGGSASAFPEVKRTLYFLHISIVTYRKILSELVSTNYIVVIQRHEDGRLGVNDYYLVQNPNEAAVSKIPKRHQKKSVRKTHSNEDLHQMESFSDIEKSDKEAEHGIEPVAAEAVIQIESFSDIEKPDTQKQDDEEQDTVKQDDQKQDIKKQDAKKSDNTINSNTKNNVTKINLFKSGQGEMPLTPLSDLIDSMDREEVVDFIKEEMGYSAISSSRYALSQFDTLIDLVADTVSKQQNKITIGQKVFDREEVAQKLTHLAYWHYEYVLDCVAKVKGKIRNLPAYYLTALFNARAGYDLEIQREVNQNLG